MSRGDPDLEVIQSEHDAYALEAVHRGKVKVIAMDRGSAFRRVAQASNTATPRFLANREASTGV